MVLGSRCRLMGFLAVVVLVGPAEIAPAQPASSMGQPKPAPRPAAKGKGAAKPVARSPIGNPKDELDAEIVARVDEEVVLLADVLHGVRSRLEQARRQLPPAQYQKFELDVLRQATQQQVERLVILKELQKKFPHPDRLETIRKKIAAEEFEKHLLRMAQQNQLAREELIQKLVEEGQNLTDIERDFVDNVLAQSYLGEMVRPLLTEPIRPMLWRYYEDHASDFIEPAGVVWEQIQINFGRDAATTLQQVQALHRQLQAGADFAELARQHSQGPTARNGGLWSLTSKGSYADDAVDAELFRLPVGQLSAVITGQRAYHIVRVRKRSAGEPQPFESVQEDIRRRLKQQQMEELRQAKFEEIKAKHYIETIFDRAQDPAPQVSGIPPERQ